MAKNILYIMTGLPYSGKTTLVKKLIEKIDCKVVSVDKILERKDLWKEKHPTQENWEIAYSEACKRVENYLINGDNVIFDEANLCYSQRENLRKMAQNFGVETKLIYVKVDKNEALKRWGENLKTKNRNQLNEKFLKKAFDLFEEPKVEEKAIIYNQEEDIKFWFKKNF